MTGLRLRNGVTVRPSRPCRLLSWRPPVTDASDIRLRKNCGLSRPWTRDITVVCSRRSRFCGELKTATVHPYAATVLERKRTITLILRRGLGWDIARRKSSKARRIAFPTLQTYFPISTP